MSVTKEQFVAAYLERIDYHGSVEPCLATLIALQRQHVYTVPFENLDLLKTSFSPNLDQDYLFDKIVLRRRGGVCYELNTSFYNLLCAMGFSVRQISGRGRLDFPITGHVFNLVHLPEGDYTADVGFGDNAIPPLRIDGGEVVEAYHARSWLKRENEDLIWVCQQRPGKDPVLQYQFTLTSRPISEYLDTFRYSAAPGNTRFSEQHICRLFTPEGCISLLRGVLTVEENGKVVESRPVPLGQETDRCLAEYFHL